MKFEFTKREDDLRDRWIASYPTELREQFCFDGLVYYRNPNSNDDYEEVVKWEKAKRKVLFLMKDTDGNPDCDYREWEFYDTETQRVHKTFITMIKQLWALNVVNSNYLPVYDKNKTREEYIDAALAYPMAIVNVKKISGGPYVHNASIRSFYKRDKSFIIEQVKDLLKPNIIVCGGGSGTILNIAKDIYSDFEFEKYNDWCYYSKQCDLLLIDDYHPAYRYRDDDTMIKSVYEFYKKKGE